MKELLAGTHDVAAASTRDYSPIDRRERGVTPRVVLLCLVLAVVFGYALPVIDYKLFNTFLGASHLPPGAIGVLLALVLVVNPLLRFFGKSLSRNEALTVYITCLFSSLVPGHGSENFLIPNLIAPFYFATPENKWLDLLQPHLKPWLMPALNANGSVNQAAVKGWYVGSNDKLTRRRKPEARHERRERRCRRSGAAPCCAAV